MTITGQNTAGPNASTRPDGAPDPSAAPDGAPDPSAGPDAAAAASTAVSFDTDPGQYRHWKLSIHGEEGAGGGVGAGRGGGQAGGSGPDGSGAVATLSLDVTEDAGIVPGYELKMNSYDLGVDIELYDAVQRLRFEHPAVRVVLITSLKDRMFCAGANIKMLAQASHAWKVNFCKFTNETLNGIEDATACSGQKYIAAVNGTAAGGGYELALACDQIVLVDDGSSVVALPEVPLLGVLPGTGGLTRLVDKRGVRRDRADVFATTAEGIRGQKAAAWRLVDETVKARDFAAAVDRRAEAASATSSRPAEARGIQLTPLRRVTDGDVTSYDHLRIEADRQAGTVTLVIQGPQQVPSSVAELHAAGAGSWALAVVRELDDAILRLRINEPSLGTWLLKTEGDLAKVAATSALLLENSGDWLVNEIIQYWKRTLRRLDTTSRSLIALIEPGSCFAGPLLEVAFAADRQYMLNGEFEAPASADGPALIRLDGFNTGPASMSNGLTRLRVRFLGSDGDLAAATRAAGRRLDAAEAARLGLVTEIPDALDWADEMRLVVEERGSFSPDALTGMEANFRFAGPETSETKIFGRLSAWQNWVFQRPNAAGPQGALSRYGTGQRADYDFRRV
jgi:benzoyl-CoA-dihydrodiol lyase